MVDEVDMNGRVSKTDVDMVERETLCIASSTPGVTSHSGDPGFLDIIRKHFSPHESNAAEDLVLLKAKLADAPTEEFWNILLEGMTNITGSQYGFVVKRILVDDHTTAVEMPALGEHGSCLMAVAIYWNDGGEKQGHVKDYRYEAFAGPCSHMRHDKVFVIPGELEAFITKNAGEFAFPVDAHMGIPLFAEGKCFGHFAAMWSAEGLQKRKLSWVFIEVILHALEDLITNQLVDQQCPQVKKRGNEPPTVIPTVAVTVAQSLKPYARSLSHELRTPMQGVVGMLEIMHANVQEALEANPNEHIESIFRTLRGNIEVVQDSSRRAIDAADNVVHAYDLNMQIGDNPMPVHNDDQEKEGVASAPPAMDNARMPINSLKRRRSNAPDWIDEPSSKHRLLSSESAPLASPHTALLRSAVEESEELTTSTSPTTTRFVQNNADRDSPHVQSPLAAPRPTNIRNLVQVVINEALRIGGRPDSTVAEDTASGEMIEIRTTISNGNQLTKAVEWSVDASVPDEIVIDERDLAKSVSVLFLNALKFTDSGLISVTASLSPSSQNIIINVTDTGLGIPEAFRPNLFKPFSREDDTIRRHSEGLGLGLWVAKVLARRVGGDLECVRSDTDGPLRGSEFELRIPLSPSSRTSRRTTPSRTTTPSRSIEDQNLPPSSESDSSTIPPQPADEKSAKSQLAEPVAVLSISPKAQHSSSPARRVNPGGSSRRRSALKSMNFDRKLAQKYPLNFLVAEDNRINRKLLVSMLSKLGYSAVLEAYDGAEAVRLMELDHQRRDGPHIDVILMDIWMPNVDGYAAAERVLAMENDAVHRARQKGHSHGVKILAVTADVTDEAIDKAQQAGMIGFMVKPFKLIDLEKIIIEYCARRID